MFQRLRCRRNTATATPFPGASPRLRPPSAIRQIVAAVEPWPDDTFFNVNFPAVAPGAVRGFAITQQGKRVLGDNLTEGVDPRGRAFYWIGPAKPEGGTTPGSDLRALEEAKISITPVHLNLTNACRRRRCAAFVQ